MITNAWTWLNEFDLFNISIPFFIVNFGKNRKPKNIADFHHHPLHAKELKIKAESLNMENVIYATGIGLFDKSQKGMNEFIFEKLK